MCKFLKVLVLLGFFLSSTKLNAQWVSIGWQATSFLKQAGYANCFNMQENLDTTCVLLLTTDSLSINSIYYSNIDFIKYFKNLKYLDLNGCNGLLSLPDLPKSLNYLDISGCYNLANSLTFPDSLKILKCESCMFANLPQLPNQLEELDCSNNKITFLPTLPNTLLKLDCGINLLQNLPTTLPIGLTHLDCTNNDLSLLPNLPNNLEGLFTGGNNLTTLPFLPNSLKHLECGGNLLTSLSGLPSSLEVIVCPANFLTTIGPLSNALKYLDCRFNSLTQLPQLPLMLNFLDFSDNQVLILPSLPDSLIELRCYKNQLSMMPPFPTSLKRVWCWENNISSLPALPNYMEAMNCGANPLTTIAPFPKVIGSFECSYTLLSSLPNLPDSIGRLDIRNNPNLTCLPRIKFIQDLRFWDTPISCLPNQGSVVSSYPKIDTLPLCGLYDTASCPFFWNIIGEISVDSNFDCSVSTSNTLLKGGIPVVVKQGVNVLQSTLLRSDGSYAFELVDTGSFEVIVDTASLPFRVSCPDSARYTLNVTSLDTTFNKIDFKVKCKEDHDFIAQSIVADVIRPANLTSVFNTAGDLAAYYNLLCANGIGGTVTTTFSGPIKFVSPVSGALSPVVNGNTLTYNVIDFNSVDFFTAFNIIVVTDTFAQSGDQVCFSLNIVPNVVDVNPSNNFFQSCFSVVNSFDPNDKIVYPLANIDTSQRQLLYTIRFQNTGTAPAQHVFITDTISEYLDISSIKLLAYSHLPIVQVMPSLIKFNFPNINLIDSNSNYAESNGYVQYEISLKENLPLGTIISNRAQIYFDFNAPVVTNTTINTIDMNTNIDASANTDILKFDLFPNPSTTQLTIVVDSYNIGSFGIITDLFGRQIAVFKLDNLSTSITTDQFSKGIYFVRVGNSIRKLIVN